MTKATVVLRLREAAVEFLWWGGGWWDLPSNFYVQPNNCVEVVFRCVVVGVVTIMMARNKTHRLIFMYMSGG